MVLDNLPIYSRFFATFRIAEFNILNARCWEIAISLVHTEVHQLINFTVWTAKLERFHDKLHVFALNTIVPKIT